jgi:hypothetical protein
VESRLPRHAVEDPSRGHEELSEHVRSVYLDSPEFPQLPDPEAAVIGTHWALQQLADACASVPRCRRAVPDVTRALSRATARLDAQPATFVSKDGAIATGSGRP